MKLYKVKGSGNIREVWDGARLVGRVHRREHDDVHVKLDLSRGRGTLRKRVVVRWTATWGDGDDPVLFGTPPARRVRCFLKEWAKPSAWAPPWATVPQEVEPR